MPPENVQETVIDGETPGDEPTLADREAALVEDLSDEALRLRLDNFEGPFEVLLYLIRSQEIDVFDIPIVKVTEQYLQFLDMMAEEDLDVAGDFLVMAAQLIEIKSKMILPIEFEDDDEEELEEEDPRLELVEKLLEYRKFRDRAQAIAKLQEYHTDCYGRRVKPHYEEVEDEDGYLEVSLYDLISAVRTLLRFLSADYVHEVELETASVDEMITQIGEMLAERQSVTWSELYQQCRGKTEIVCCLLAILELCRMSRIRVHQHTTFGDIRIFAHDPEEQAPSAAG